MQDALLMDQDYRLWALLDLARVATYKARERELGKYGISLMESAVLFVIQANTGATPAELSRWLLRESHTMSSLVSRMEKAGLVKKVKDLDRKNWIRVAITEKGKEAYQQSAERKVLHNIMSSLSKEEQQQLESLLRKLLSEALKELSLDRKVPFP